MQARRDGPAMFDIMEVSMPDKLQTRVLCSDFIGTYITIHTLPNAGIISISWTTIT